MLCRRPSPVHLYVVTEEGNVETLARKFALREVKRPQVVSEVLTGREVRQRFGLDHRWLYQQAHLGLLHPIQVGGKGRIYWPEWEVRELVKALDTATKAEQLELELTA